MFHSTRKHGMSTEICGCRCISNLKYVLTSSGCQLLRLPRAQIFYRLMSVRSIFVGDGDHHRHNFQPYVSYHLYSRSFFILFIFFPNLQSDASPREVTPHKFGHACMASSLLLSILPTAPCRETRIYSFDLAQSRKPTDLVTIPARDTP